jgi:hypothetical protein
LVQRRQRVRNRHQCGQQRGTGPFPHVSRVHLEGPDPVPDELLDRVQEPHIGALKDAAELGEAAERLLARAGSGVTEGTDLCRQCGQPFGGMVINAAGPWAGAVARLAGQDLPVVPVRPGAR